MFESKLLLLLATLRKYTKQGPGRLGSCIDYNIISRPPKTSVIFGKKASKIISRVDNNLGKSHLTIGIFLESLTKREFIKEQFIPKVEK